MARIASLAAALTALAAPAAAAPSWDFVVDLTDFQRGRAEVDWQLRGFADGPVTVCGDMSGAGKPVRDLRQLDGPADKKGRALARSRDDDDCFTGAVARAGALHLAYRYELGKLADDRENFDWAARIEKDGYVFNDETLLLRPDPLPDDAQITVELKLPPGMEAAAPWQRLPGPGFRFRYDAAQYDAGAYVAVGKLASLGEIPIAGGTVRVTIFDRPRAATRDELFAWLKRALEPIGKFYRGLPGGHVHLVLVPVPGTSDGGVFGTILRRATPSVVLLFGAEAHGPDFADDWVAAHELFHLGNPPVAKKVPWFVEGFTTYYQDVLRGRAGAVSAQKMWSDLYDGFRRHCDPVAASLEEESHSLGKTHHYTRVYWGGACLAFRIDAAIREHTKGASSLDDVMRALRASDHELEEQEIVAALDQAAGAPIAREHLAARAAIPLVPLLQKLGIIPIGPEQVKLREDAPEAPLRRGIF